MAMKLSALAAALWMPVAPVAAQSAPPVTLARALPAGAALTEEDVLLADPEDAASAALLAGLAGKEARRLLPKGAALREVDFRAPLLVERNAPVIMEYAKGALVMTTEGRALSNGSQDEFVKVMNARSKTIVTARVVARGKVVVQ